MAKTLFDKLWQEHEVETLSERESLLYIDRIFLHERTGSVALNSLLERGRQVRQREHAFCTMDHIVDTLPGRGDETLMPSGKDFIIATRSAAQETGIRLFDIQDPDQGIVHVISPELGIALPGLSLVCPDSHTCTLGGLGALAWGVGSTEAEHALATSTLRVTRPGTMQVIYEGLLSSGVTAKDLMLVIGEPFLATAWVPPSPVIAVSYQFSVLLMPTLAPVLLWVLQLKGSPLWTRLENQLGKPRSKG